MSDRSSGLITEAFEVEWDFVTSFVSVIIGNHSQVWDTQVQLLISHQTIWDMGSNSITNLPAPNWIWKITCHGKSIGNDLQREIVQNERESCVHPLWNVHKLEFSFTGEWINSKHFFVSWFQSFDLNQANGDVNNGSVGYFNKAFVQDVTPTNDVKIPIDTKVTHATANGSVKRKQTRSHGESVTLEEENWDVVELEDTTTPWKGTVIIFVLSTLFSNSVIKLNHSLAW